MTKKIGTPPPAASTPAATPEAVSVVAATPAPTPAATGTPDVPPTATASPATSSSPPPASRWAVNAEDLPTFVFLGDVPEAQQEEVRKRTADIVGFFDELYGIHVPGLTLYFSETVPLLQGATEEVLGVSRTVACGEYSGGSMFVASRCAERAIEHEYFHAIQHHVAPTTTWGPWWLQEGAAEFAAIRFRDATGRESYDDAIDFISWALSYSLIELEDLDVVQGVFVSDSLHQTSTLAASHLASDASERSFVDYYSSLSDSVSWRDTFHTTFGITVPDFYSSFRSYRSDVVVVRHAVRGAIVGPDGEPVHRWRIDIEASPVGSSRQGDLRVDASSEGLDGTFTSQLPDGTYELSLATRCMWGRVELGWYGGESGFTTDYDSVSHVVVDGEGVEGIVVRLPAQPSGLSDACDVGPRRTVSGVVTYPDGTPIPGLRVTAFDFIDWLSPDTTVVGEDGTFRLEIPDSTYELDVRESCEIWLGAYDVANDSFLEPPIWGSETVPQVHLRVDGEDISGIEIVIPSGPLHALSGRTLSEWRALVVDEC